MNHAFGKLIATLSALLISHCVSAQKGAYLGINTASLAIQALELRSEWQISRILSAHGGAGFRAQNRPPGATPFFQGLNPYIQQQNRAAFVSGGFRVYEAVTGKYDYPFFAAEAALIYYHDRYLPSGPVSPPQESRGMAIAFSGAMGFVVRLGKRTDLDLALQMGYSPPRGDLLSYYYPGAGYATFGYAVIGFKGGHVQPQVTLKYQIIRSKRQKIREQT